MTKLEGYMSPIKNHNAGVSKCLQEGCSSKPTQWGKILVHRVPILLALCDKHADELDNRLYWDIEDAAVEAGERD